MDPVLVIFAILAIVGALIAFAFTRSRTFAVPSEDAGRTRPPGTPEDLSASIIEENTHS